MKIGNIEVYGIIYKITNMINGKCYIGQTVNGFDKRYKAKGTGIEKVYKYNKRMKDSGKELYNDHSKGLLNVEKRIFDKYIKPYGNIDIDRINVTSKSKITIEKLRQFNGWIIEEVA